MQEYKNIFDKLNNHSLPADASYWDEIEKRLQNDDKKVIPLYVWLAGAGVAASLALLLTMRILINSNENFNAQIEHNSESYIIEEECTTKFPDDPELLPASYPTVSNNGKPRPVRDNMLAENCPVRDNMLVESLQHTQPLVPLGTKRHCEGIARNNQETAPLQECNPKQSELFLEINKNETDNEIIINTVSNTVQDTIIEKQYILPSEYDLFVLYEPEKKKNKKSNQIALAFSSGISNSGSNPGFSNKAEYDYQADRYVSPYLKSSDEPSLEDLYYPFSEVSHLPPLSVGLMFRKNFNKTWAIESGLTYSYLRSNFKEDDEWYHRDAALQLHYIGIPLNAVVYIINDKPKWNLYFSPGIMMERGIGFNYVQHEYNKYDNGLQAPSHNTNLQDKIHGLQWSANASFGIGCKLSPVVILYLEPRIIYYFKNNQPISARTEMPLLVGFSAGLRFEIN
jgi:hypothetical protein